jgi:hypothetical protein
MSLDPVSQPIGQTVKAYVDDFGSGLFFDQQDCILGGDPDICEELHLSQRRGCFRLIEWFIINGNENAAGPRCVRGRRRKQGIKTKNARDYHTQEERFFHVFSLVVVRFLASSNSKPT